MVAAGRAQRAAPARTEPAKGPRQRAGRGAVIPHPFQRKVRAKANYTSWEKNIVNRSVNRPKPAGEPGREELSGNKMNWVLLFVAAFFVYVNLFVSITIFPQYAVEIGCTPLQSGLQNTLFFVTAVILRFYCGPYADRRGRKRACGRRFCFCHHALILAVY